MEDILDICDEKNPISSRNKENQDKIYKKFCYLNDPLADIGARGLFLLAYQVSFFCFTF